MTERIDARNLLTDLSGSLIHTLTGAPNRILRVDETDVIVAAGRSPAGRPVPIAWVQTRSTSWPGTVRSQSTWRRCATGARSWAVLAMLPGARTSLRPAMVRLTRGDR